MISWGFLFAACDQFGSLWDQFQVRSEWVSRQLGVSLKAVLHQLWIIGSIRNAFIMLLGTCYTILKIVSIIVELVSRSIIDRHLLLVNPPSPPPHVSSYLFINCVRHLASHSAVCQDRKFMNRGVIGIVPWNTQYPHTTPIPSTMMHHEYAWCIMSTHDDASWVLMMHHECSWNIMGIHEASWEPIFLDFSDFHLLIFWITLICVLNFGRNRIPAKISLEAAGASKANFWGFLYPIDFVRHPKWNKCFTIVFCDCFRRNSVEWMRNRGRSLFNHRFYL